MPELPEVESVRQSLEDKILGQNILSAKRSSFSLRKKNSLKAFKSLEGQKILRLERWGKRIFFILSTNEVVDVSLGMTGKFRIEKLYKKQKHDHIVLKLDKNYLVYNDSRRFGWFYFSKEQPLRKGWDPLLGKESDYKKIIKRAQNSTRSLYDFLMDQNNICGLGNIYVQEILFETRLSPHRETMDLSLEDWLRLKRVTRRILKKSLRYGGTTIINYRSLNEKEGLFQKKLKVYGKKNSGICLKCGQKLQSFKTSGRYVTYCKTCQK